MKFLVAVAVLVLVSAQAFADELGDNNNWEPNYWSDWSDAARNKVRKDALPGLGGGGVECKATSLPHRVGLFEESGDALLCRWDLAAYSIQWLAREVLFVIRVRGRCSC